MHVPFDGELSTKDAIARELLAEASERSAPRRREDSPDESDGSAGFRSAESAVDVEILTGGAE
jgi:hypothetical protein